MPQLLISSFISYYLLVNIQAVIFAKSIRSFSICNNFPQNLWLSFRGDFK